ncbi:gp23 [Rhodococcus phage ReqiPine5]|uniref:Gp23 n=1 Tax=Rhodococcus phage ReqiPine5 TaxID=691963 RepID=D4P7Z8_9CAUD|nr:gp23 [Rhodococcus phage ReqiPine5]ADD81128.1 gp23 [Rhodococcus phage ReqiPine5]
MHDPLSCAVDHTIYSLKRLFANDSPDPPLGGGTDDVKFFHADEIPLAWFNAHLGGDCDDADPFIWVRVISRYKSSNFPAPDLGGACSQNAAEIEVGIGRCSYLGEDGDVDFDKLRTEANISLDDSRRIEKALCLASARMLKAGNQCANNTARDIVVPIGPDGGVVGWSASIYVQLD